MVASDHLPMEAKTDSGLGPGIREDRGIVVQFINEGGTPDRVFLDKKPEFLGKALDKCAYANQVTLDFSRQGKPTDTAVIESFNGTFRGEGLNAHWFFIVSGRPGKIRTLGNRA